MTSPTLGVLNTSGRGNWIRLRTLIMLRWFAIAGQLAAISVSYRIFGLDLPLGLCFVVVGVSVIANLIAMSIYPENKRLNETEAVLTLLFDVSQLVLLLALTGGLHNPFALLVLAPVTIAATTLNARSTVALATIAVALITLVGLYNLPLTTKTGMVLVVPAIFLFGSWIAIVIGVVFLSVYARWVTSEINSMSDALSATQMALSREQMLTGLGGVVAAAAHELGTPLATIKLVSSELMEELEDDETLREDAALIREQADRCRDILRSMGRAGKDDLHLRQAPFSAVVREAAEPHTERGKVLEFTVEPGPGGGARQPLVLRRPEVIHGLRNLIQNAVDFAETQVWVDARWTDERIWVRISDDGKGFPSQLLGRIGDPFVRLRRDTNESTERPGYEGMGLGLFIAKTLLERSGAELNFVNGSVSSQSPGKRSGALVEVVWPREKISAEGTGETMVLGENQPFEI